MVLLVNSEIVEMNNEHLKLSAEGASAKRRLLTEIVAHFPSEEVVNYYVATLRELVPTYL